MDARQAEVLAVIPWWRIPGVFPLAFAVAMALSFRDEPPSPGLAFWGAVIAALAWLGLAMLLNTTRVRLRGEALEAVHGPVPWLTRRVPRHRIRAVRAFARPSRDRDTAGWTLEVVTVTGERVSLLPGPLPVRFAVVDAAARAIASRLGVTLE